MFSHAGLAIRPIEEEDLAFLVALRADPAIWTNLGHIEPIGLERQRRWFRSLQERQDCRYYVLCADSAEAIGMVRFDEIDVTNRSIRVGGDIESRLHGQGYGRRMFKLIKKYCFNYLNMNRIWLLVLETNVVAIKLYKGAGFADEGRQRQAIFRDGQYIDYLMMSMLRSEYEQESQP